MSTADYQSHRERAAERQATQSRTGRDIGQIPPIADIQRRESCRFSLEQFCRIYNPEAFYWDWSPDQRKAIARIEESLLQGALFAFAMPRGAGKSSLCRHAALWAVAYAHCRYVFLIGANADKAVQTLDALKIFLRFLPELAADFPEISYPAQCLGGIANRSSGQLCQGQSTLIAWSDDRVILPTVPPPENWPESWPLRKDGKVPTSGVIVGASGLTGEGIRGSLHTLATGEQIRPDFVLLDDPQTDESAASRTQNETRERLVSGAVLGMAGPGRRISAVMPCTVIQRDDFVDRILDRKKHPLWRGERSKMLRTMPSDMTAWEKYFELYEHCAQKEPPDFTEANDYYREHRAALDAGAEASWESRKEEDEVSAIQHAMNIYCRDKVGFFAEYQNEPLARNEAADELTSDQVAAKINRYRRNAVPVQCTHLTAFIDVQQTLLFYAVVGWSTDFTGFVLDYGTWPDQARTYFALRDLRRTIASVTKIAGLEAQIYGAMTELTTRIIGRDWQREDGALMRISRCLIDANWGSSTDTIYQFCRQSGYAATVMPSHGRYVGASSHPFSEYKKKAGDQVGTNWRVPNVQGRRAVRYVLFDANYWKSFVHARLAVPMGGKGCLSIFGDNPQQHRLFSEHLTAEYRIRTEGRGRTVDEWKLRPDRSDNHWLDCLVGCAVAASMEGVLLPGGQFDAPGRSRRRVAIPEHMRVN